MTALERRLPEVEESTGARGDGRDSRPMALVVEPALELRASIGERLEALGFRVVEARHGLEAWPLFRSTAPDLVIAALRSSGMDGVELVRRVRRVSKVTVLLHARAPDISEAVAGMREGAGDVLGLPGDFEKLEQHARRVVRRRRARPTSDDLAQTILGRSHAMQRVRERVAALAGLRVPVLLVGEPGTGRDHVARALHEAGSDGRRRLVVVPAERDVSAARQPDAHVYYLDGIEHFAAPAQARWLQLLGDARRRPATGPHRILASTSADLPALVREGRFDARLADEIGRFRLELPGLVKRREDVGALAQFLASRAARSMGRGAVQLTGPAIRALAARSWPGNLRELEIAVEKLVAFSREGRIGVDEVRQVLEEEASSIQSLRREREERQRRELIELLEQTGGNLAEAARRLDMSRGAIIYRAQKYGLLSGGR